MKKRMLILAALVVVCSMALTACDGGSGDGETTPETSAATVTETDAPMTLPVVTEAPTEAPTEANLATYTIQVVDQDGNPVEKAFVQMCNDGACFLPKATDATGAAAFEQDPTYTYQAKLTSLPEGYTGDTESYFDFEDGAVTITVTKG